MTLIRQFDMIRTYHEEQTAGFIARVSAIPLARATVMRRDDAQSRLS